MTRWGILWKTLLGSLLLLVGIGTLGYVEYWHLSHHPLAARLPLSMTVGHFRTGDFVLDISCPYIVVIDFDRPAAMSDTRLDCMMGAVTPEDNCSGISPVLNVAWTLTSEGREVASGSSDSDHAYYWDRGPTRILGGFRGNSGTHYMLDLEVKSDASVLFRARPELQIRPASMEYYSDFFIERGIIRFAAAISILLGALFLLLAQVQRRRYKKFSYARLQGF